MIGKIISGILSFIIGLVSTLMAPIDLLITNNIPVLSDALGYINSFIDYIISIIGYVIDASMLSDVSIGLIVAYYLFATTASITARFIKLTIRWYNALKL